MRRRAAIVVTSLALAFLTLPMSGCAWHTYRDDRVRVEREALVGTWNLVDERSSATMTLAEDGTATLSNWPTSLTLCHPTNKRSLVDWDRVETFEGRFSTDLSKRVSEYEYDAENYYTELEVHLDDCGRGFAVKENEAGALFVTFYLDDPDFGDDEHIMRIVQSR